MNIDWNKIKNEYPESWYDFLEYIYRKKQGIDDNFSLSINFIKNIDIRILYLCYCDIEKYFDDNEININIYFSHNRWINTNIESFAEIKNERGNIIWITETYKTRREAKEQAIYKAFEILKNILIERNINNVF